MKSHTPISGQPPAIAEIPELSVPSWCDPLVAAGPFERRELVLSWLGLWFFGWAATALAGALFGLVITLLLGGQGLERLAGFYFGFVIAGICGAIVFSHIAIFCWMFWLQMRPLFLVGLAGGLTGCLCGLPFFLLTGPMGAAAAYLAGKWYVTTPSGFRLAVIERQRILNREKSPGRIHFSLADLFWRMTATAGVLAFWCAIWRQWP